ncbi:FG-GAP repeat domain-containing protein, partial [Embleya sp. NPDC059267]
GEAVALHTILSRPDGGFQIPFDSWQVPAGNWNWTRVQLTAGDYDGDGRTDVATMYDYGGGESGLFTFIAGTNGGFGASLNSWKSPVGTWWSEDARPVSGDVDHDGRADIAAVYNLPDGSSRFRTFRSGPDGLFTGFVEGWQSTPGTW